MNKKKLVKLGASLALVGVVGVGATLAYLQTGVEDLTNSFTIGTGYPEGDGKYALVLDEDYNGEDNELVENVSPIENTDDTNGKKRTMYGNTYTIYPNTTVNKDPQVSLNQESPDSYIFVAIKGEDDFGEYVTTHVNTTADDSTGMYWMKVSSKIGTTETDGVYVLAKNGSPFKVETNGNEGEYYTFSPKVFDQVKIENMSDSEADKFIEENQGKQIKVWAVAVQATDVVYADAADQAINALETAAGITQ